MTIGSLASGGSASSGGVVYLGANNLTVGSNNTSTVFSGVIRDSGGDAAGVGGSLTKVGSGILDLTGASTYTGNTIVSGGTLQVDGQILSPTTTVIPGGRLTGGGVIGGNLVNNGAVSPINSLSSFPTTLTVTGKYAQSSSGALGIGVLGTAPSLYSGLKVIGSVGLSAARSASIV